MRRYRNSLNVPEAPLEARALLASNNMDCIDGMCSTVTPASDLPPQEEDSVEATAETAGETGDLGPILTARPTGDFTANNFKTPVAEVTVDILDATDPTATEIEVTLTNSFGEGGLTTSPAAIFAHDGRFSSATPGETVSAGFAKLAERGNPDDLLAEHPDITSTRLAEGPFGPGESRTATLIIDTTKVTTLEVVSMLVPSNDAVVMGRIDLLNQQGQAVASTTQLTGKDVYDAGSEVNDENVGVAGLNQTDDSQGEDENGVFARHPGFLGSEAMNGKGTSKKKDKDDKKGDMNGKKESKDDKKGDLDDKKGKQANAASDSSFPSDLDAASITAAQHLAARSALAGVDVTNASAVLSALDEASTPGAPLSREIVLRGARANLFSMGRQIEAQTFTEVDLLRLLQSGQI